jgi:hypothetical protein
MVWDRPGVQTGNVMKRRLQPKKRRRWSKGSKSQESSRRPSVTAGRQKSGGATEVERPTEGRDISGG